MSVNPNETVHPQAPPPVNQEPPAERVPLQEKYQGDWRKANDGYFNAVQELGRVHDLANNFAQENQRLQQAVGALSGGGQPVSNDPLQRLQTELGLPPEPFAQAIDARVASVMEQQLKQMFDPIIKQVEADEKLATEIDNFHELRDRARKYLKTNQEVEQTFNAVRQMNPVNAWKYAIREMLIADQGAAPPRTPVHAGLPGGRQVEGRGQVNPAGAPQATREQEALQYARDYGDGRPYAHERFRGTSVERAIRDIAQRNGVNIPEGW